VTNIAKSAYFTSVSKKEMSMPLSRAAALGARHSKLEKQILEEAKRPLPDAGRLAGLKRQKLMIKDELSRVATPS